MSFDKARNNQKEIKDKKNDINSPLYISIFLYKVDSKWRWLNDIGKDEAAKEFSVIDRHCQYKDEG